ncbi:MAG: DUF6452 family protein [Bacteroidales bacterium]
MKKLYLFFSFACLLALAYACTEESCEQETEVMMQAGFYESGSGNSLTVDSLSIYGLYMPDSLIYSNAKLGEAGLPLNPSAPYCSFIIITGSRHDTIEILYEPELMFLSRACGYTYTYTLKEVLFTNNNISNILIVNEQVNPGNEENIQIFF